ncbi:hypothetical protein RIF29_29534 [Crotalaria pallida]|uniref:Uncharacterized protein n=1 Tax=Crotalaria pallida TaxID=3830 RepID=A0AAN9EGW4_CROPI
MKPKTGRAGQNSKLEETMNNSTHDSNIRSRCRVHYRDTESIPERLWSTEKIGSFLQRVKKKAIADVVRKNGIYFLVVQEKKMEVVDRSSCSRLWSDDDFDWDFVPSTGRSGGLISMWRSSSFSKSNTVHGSGFLIIQRTWVAGSCSCIVVNVYSPCDLVDKIHLWQQLLLVKQQFV